VTQYTFRALWRFADEIRRGELTVADADCLCQLMAGRLARDKRRAGYEVRRHTTVAQVRRYWSPGVPCGLSCPVYVVEVEHAEAK
jgi:hypothetical protein